MVKYMIILICGWQYY